jgi:hypothetical protein
MGERVKWADWGAPLAAYLPEFQNPHLITEFRKVRIASQACWGKLGIRVKSGRRAIGWASASS